MDDKIKQSIQTMVKNIRSNDASRAIAIILALQTNEKIPFERTKSINIDWCSVSNGSTYPEINIEFYPS